MSSRPADPLETPARQPLEKGKLYRWDGQDFQEVVFERSAERKVPIADDAFELAQKVRLQVQKKLKMRPEMALVISAMVRHAAKSPDIADAIAQYGLDRYAANKSNSTE